MPELADELGIPFETARSRLRLGIQKLRARVFRRGLP
jgi:DNA-directed RNA polymerase specialized sigma24 family protein